MDSSAEMLEGGQAYSFSGITRLRRRTLRTFRRKFPGEDKEERKIKERNVTFIQELTRLAAATAGRMGTQCGACGQPQSERSTWRMDNLLQV